jgi:hypothetical protein
VINRIANLRYLLIETAFPNSERRLAEISKHLCPSMLAEELKQAEGRCRDLHQSSEAQPDRADNVRNRGLRRRFQAAPMLYNNQVFDF